MPTYEYRCDSCGERLERFQAMSDAPLEECPACGGHLTRCIGTGSGILFKGTGFYATDYGGSSGGKGAGLGSPCNRDRPCCGRDTPCGRSPRTQ
jgi:putative FmdB family regulatory protein